MPSRRLIATAALAALACGLVVTAAPSGAAQPKFVSKSLSFRSTDGTVLHATVGGFGSLKPRPVIVEDSPYSPSVDSLSWLGASYNYVQLQWRGTGLSEGALTSTGPADQRDLSAFLGWACRQPWSNGQLGYYGFSASAIVAYNTMHLPMPCVKTAVLMAGSVDLYRDLLNIGGIPNLAAGAYVEAAIGLPTLAASGQRLQRGDPASSLETLLSYPQASLDVLGNPTLNKFWRERTFRGDRDRIPILADTSFYDVEPRGPFHAFNATNKYGSHLLVYGAHDGHPAGTPGPFPQYQNWFDHYLLGKPLSAENRPKVSIYAGNGSRQEFLANHVTHLTGSTWPLRGTRWRSLYLAPDKSGSVQSLNDGTLVGRPPAEAVSQSYPFLPSEATETDVHTIATVAGLGIDQAARYLPALTNMQLSGPTSLTYTTPPLRRAVTSVGPGAVNVWLSSSAPVTDLYVVVADVWPDGTAYPVGTGALRTAYPLVDRSRSLRDRHGTIVDPYNNFTTRKIAPVGVSRRYQIELLPIGNRFGVGHRIRLYFVGTPADQLPSPPGLNTIRLGGLAPSRLLLPTVTAKAKDSATHSR